MRRLLAAAVLVLVTATGCALFPADPSNEAIRTAVAGVTAPAGWTEVGSIEQPCAVLNIDCQDSSVRRVFRTDGDAAAACSDLVQYVAVLPPFQGAQGLVGASPQPPAVEACQDELAAYGRYLVIAEGPSGRDAGEWRLRLTPDDDGFALSVVLGDPPRDPWA